MVLAVVDDDLQTLPKLLEARYDVGFTEVVGHHTDLRLLVGNGLVEHLEDGVARFEAHPLQSLSSLRMGRNEY